MILGQLVPHHVSDKTVLTAMMRVPRERFLSERLQTLAYTDETLFLKTGRFLHAPLIQARLLQAAGVRTDDFVLNLQCATGYTSVLLSKTALGIVAVESDSEMRRIAQDLLIDMKIDNVALFDGKTKDGFVSQAPYDLIFIDGVVPFFPENLLEQVTPDGRLICVVAEPSSLIGTAVKASKVNNKIRKETLFNFLLKSFCQTKNFKKFDFDKVS